MGRVIKRRRAEIKAGQAPTFLNLTLIHTAITTDKVRQFEAQATLDLVEHGIRRSVWPPETTNVYIQPSDVQATRVINSLKTKEAAEAVWLCSVWDTIQGEVQHPNLHEVVGPLVDQFPGPFQTQRESYASFFYKNGTRLTIQATTPWGDPNRSPIKEADFRLALVTDQDTYSLSKGPNCKPKIVKTENYRTAASMSSSYTDKMELATEDELDELNQVLVDAFASGKVMPQYT